MWQLKAKICIYYREVGWNETIVRSTFLFDLEYEPLPRKVNFRSRAFNCPEPGVSDELDMTTDFL